MKFHKYYILLFLISMLSCRKKKYPESIVENDAVYNFAATVGNQQVSLKAGIGGYYMYSLVQQDSNNVYNFIGDLKQENCSDCRNSLRVQINDFKVSLPDVPAKIDSSLFPRTYSILSGLSNYKVQFQSQFNKPAANYEWTFGDGASSTDANPVHMYTKAGYYPVKLKITSTGGCESIINNVEHLDDNPDRLKAYLAFTTPSATSVSYSPVVNGGVPPYSYVWSYGDGSTSNSSYHIYAIGGAYPVSVRITDSGNRSVTLNYNAVTLNDPSSCAANYTVQDVTQVVNLVTAKALSKIIISWTDADGNVYTSNNDLQPASSHFEVMSVEDAGLNENNQPTKKLRLKFNCTVYNGTRSLAIENAETTICVAYK